MMIFGKDSISSSYHIAKFWDLTGHPRAAPIRRSKSIISPPTRQDRATAETSGVAGYPLGDVSKPTRRRQHLIDVQAFITHALTAAGLMKS